MEVRVEHLGNVQFEITAREHKILCDQPLDKGGDDEGMTPPELMLGSLASCAAYYAAEYLKKRGLATEGTRVRLTAEKFSDQPGWTIFRLRSMCRWRCAKRIKRERSGQ